MDERDTSRPISKASDRMLRGLLHEAANVLFSQAERRSALQQWGMNIAEARGVKPARLAFARKLAALLNSLWLDETAFRWA
ncbi:hypothetical protein [Blastomonas sp. SL216]|uniref:hypothetical protein n=1 Tax=Blastomonas sp. SL216 TaxID=2995169 RepID=UPI00237799CA|nr:hypothetical protein OU999_08730 [Blastomonas sp. SL216]